MMQETEVTGDIQQSEYEAGEFPPDSESPVKKEMTAKEAMANEGGEGTPAKRKPGRPKKKKEEKTNDELVQNIEDREMQRPGVKHIFRTISEKNVFTDTGAVPASALESYIQTYLMNGWEILNTHFLGKVIEGYTIMYVLVKYS